MVRAGQPAVCADTTAWGHSERKGEGVGEDSRVQVAVRTLLGGRSEWFGDGVILATRRPITAHGRREAAARG